MSESARDIVLVIDDSPDTLTLLTDALEQSGATVLVATHGDQALSIVERITPDIVLLDALMPGMDGFETCRRLKAKPEFAHVPVLFMTGLTETEHILEGFQAGSVDYLRKPIVPEELLARIRVHLANARASHSARTALDTAGRFLLAADLAGRVLWYTPKAAGLLRRAFAGFVPEGFVLPEPVRDWLARQAAPGTAGGVPAPIDAGEGALQLSFIGRFGANELLLRLAETRGPDETQPLKERLGLTSREAEVLLWVARGKSNKDVGEILQLSPRTVNKHLEQIYNKLGVENRAAATALATRVLGS